MVRCIPDVMLKVGSIGTDPFPQWGPTQNPAPTADRWEWITTFLFGDDKGIKKLLKDGHHTATRNISLALPHTANPPGDGTLIAGRPDDDIQWPVRSVPPSVVYSPPLTA